MTFNTTISHKENEIEVTVEYTYIPSCRGSRDSLGGIRGAGPPLEPDEPAECEITSIIDADGNDLIVDVSDAVIDHLADKAMDDVASRQQPEPPEPDYGEDF